MAKALLSCFVCLYTTLAFSWTEAHRSSTKFVPDQKSFELRKKGIEVEFLKYQTSQYSPFDLALFPSNSELVSQIHLLWQITEGGFDDDRVHLELGQWSGRPEAEPFLLYYSARSNPAFRPRKSPSSSQRPFHISDFLNGSSLENLSPISPEIDGYLFNQLRTRWGTTSAYYGLTAASMIHELKQTGAYLDGETWKKEAIPDTVRVQTLYKQFLEEARISVPTFRIPIARFPKDVLAKELRSVQEILPPDAPWRINITQDAIEGRILSPLGAAFQPNSENGAERFAPAQRFQVNTSNRVADEVLSDNHIRELAMASAVWTRHLNKWSQEWVLKMRAPFRSLGREKELVKLEEELMKSRQLHTREIADHVENTMREAQTLEEHLRSVRGKPNLLPWVKRILPKKGSLASIFRTQESTELQPTLLRHPIAPQLASLIAFASVGIVVGLDILDIQAAQKTAISFEDLSLRISRTVVDAGLGTGMLVAGLNSVRAMSPLIARASVGIFAVIVGMEVVRHTVYPDFPTFTTATDVFVQYLSDAMLAFRDANAVVRGKNIVLEEWQKLKNLDDFRWVTIFKPGVSLMDVATAKEDQIVDMRELARLNGKEFKQEANRRRKFGRYSVEELAKSFSYGYVKLTMATLQFLSATHQNLFVATLNPTAAKSAFTQDLARRFEIVRLLSAEISGFLKEFNNLREELAPQVASFYGMGEQSTRDHVARLMYELKYCARVDSNGELKRIEDCTETPIKKKVLDGLKELYGTL